MSKTETKPEVNPNEFKKTYKYFDLDAFEKKTIEKTITFNPHSDANAALQAINSDPAKLLSALNAYLKKEELKKAKREVAALGADTAIVMSIAKGFRALPPFNAIYELDANGKPKVEKGEKVINRAEQTKQVLAFLKANPAIIDGIRKATLEAAEADDEGEEKKSEDDED